MLKVRWKTIGKIGTIAGKAKKTKIRRQKLNFTGNNKHQDKILRNLLKK
jgi:hypothetical protein